MAVITISRQYSSRGDEIAARVCVMLGYRYFDKRLMAQIASETGFSESEMIDFSEDDYKVRTFRRAPRAHRSPTGYSSQAYSRSGTYRPGGSQEMVTQRDKPAPLLSCASIRRRLPSRRFANNIVFSDSTFRPPICSLGNWSDHFRTYAPKVTMQFAQRHTMC
jgi:hypothetical protein